MTNNHSFLYINVMKVEQILKMTYEEFDDKIVSVPCDDYSDVWQYLNIAQKHYVTPYQSKDTDWQELYPDPTPDDIRALVKNKYFNYRPHWDFLKLEDKIMIIHRGNFPYKILSYEDLDTEMIKEPLRVQYPKMNFEKYQESLVRGDKLKRVLKDDLQ